MRKLYNGTMTRSPADLLARICTEFNVEIGELLHLVAVEETDEDSKR
ncbi:helix-turn-helix domain-containing protein [Salipaludibacillus agaradhaerens]